MITFNLPAKAKITVRGRGITIPLTGASDAKIAALVRLALQTRASALAWAELKCGDPLSITRSQARAIRTELIHLIR